MIKDNELIALITLLDDEDPEVHEHVWEKLSSLGKDGINRLEAAWETEEDPEIQKKIEDLIHHIHLHSVTRDLLAWRKTGGKDLLEGWMILGKTRFPDLDESKYLNHVKRLVHKTWLELDPHMDPLELFEVISHMFFQVERFRPNRKRVKDPENYFLNHFMDTHKGNAFSMGLLYLIICKKLELPVSGVILPGYFVLHYFNGIHEAFIDVFNGGVVLSKEKWTEILKKYKIEEKPSYFKPTSNIYIILEMIKGLATDYRNLGDLAKSEEYEQLLQDIEIRLG